MPALKGSLNHNFGKPLADETKQKLRDINLGRKHTEATKIKMSESAKKKVFTKEHRENMRKARLGKKQSPATKVKISNALIGKIVTEKTRTRMSESSRKSELRKQLYRDPCWLQSRSDATQSEKNPAWKGGISFEPYCQKFNDEFKERVRAFFGYQCVECLTPQNGRKLHVHHINYDKMVCCNDVQPLFVALCNSHNVKTNHNRPYWEQHFTEIINTYYEGKCYFTKDEMKAFQQGVMA